MAGYYNLMIIANANRHTATNSVAEKEWRAGADSVNGVLGVMSDGGTKVIKPDG